MRHMYNMSSKRYCSENYTCHHCFEKMEMQKHGIRPWGDRFKGQDITCRKGRGAMQTQRLHVAIWYILWPQSD